MTYPIPSKALESHIAILGKAGSGKTWAAKGLVEGVLDAGGRACVIDPTGVWHGLRTSASGKSAGYAVAIFGGEHGDFPLAGTHGEALAEIVATSSTPVIIDTSLMRVGERTRFFADFGEAILRRNRGPLHLVVDEAHLFAPQGRVNDPQSGQMLHAANNMVSLGRARGLRVVLISQRPAKLHKDSLTQAETLVAMRLVAPQDRGAVEEWIEDNADEAKAREILSSLATLKTGQAWVWAPVLDVLERVTFPKIKTLDTSAAPTAGDREVDRVLAPIDRDAITAKLGAIAKETEANDPKKLRARIAELERQARTVGGDDTKSYAARNEGFQEGKAAGYQEGIAAAASKNGELRRAYEGAVDRLEAALRAFTADMVEAFSEARPTQVPHKSDTSPAYGTPALRAAQAARHEARANMLREIGNGAGDRPPVQQRILDALAELELLGQRQPDRELVAFMANYAHTRSKGFINALGALSSGGLVRYPPGGKVELTDEGRRAAVAPERPRTPAELQERVVGMLGGASERILRPLIQAYPEALDRAEVAAAAGYEHVRSKGFVNAIGRLRSLGFIDYPGPGTIAAQPVLFLE